MYKKIYETYKKVVDENLIKDLFINNHYSMAELEDMSKDLIEDIKNNKLLIYTAFTGDYDTLKDPEIIDENCDYVCFTDNPNVESDLWKIIYMEDSNLDNNRKAKQYKVLPHKYFPEYKYSLWIDGTFKIKKSIREYIYKYAKNSMLCAIHPERDCIYEEEKISSKIPRYPKPTLENQVKKYSKEGLPSHYGLPALGVIFRQHNNLDVIKVMEDWWEEIITFTNQDQISFSYVCWKNNFNPSISPYYYWDNEYWAKKQGKYHHKAEARTPITSYNLINSFKGNVQENNNLTREEMYLWMNDVYALEALAEAQDEEITKMVNSSSWKLTKPLRFLGFYFKKLIK